MLVSALLGLIGLAICALVCVEARNFWSSRSHVMPWDYLMMFYYGLVGLCGVACVCC